MQRQRSARVPHAPVLRVGCDRCLGAAKSFAAPRTSPPKRRRCATNEIPPPILASKPTSKMGPGNHAALGSKRAASPVDRPLQPHHPKSPSPSLVAPSAHHWMGTDELGRDILSRILFGARVSMLVSICVVLGSGITGLAIGAIAGYFGGWLDRIVNIVLINAFLSFPGILLAIAFAAFLGPGLGKVILALTITGWAGYARLARAQVLQAKEMEYVLAAKSLGASDAQNSNPPLDSKYSATNPDPSHNRNGRRNPRRIHAELPRSRRASSNAKLGRNAQRRPRPPLRRSAPRNLPSRQQ